MNESGVGSRGGSGAEVSIPHLRKKGSATQLIVEGKPFLILGGELHNSSSSSLAYMRPIWQRIKDLNFNTVLAPVSWELIEPEEGRFDFTLVDGLIHEARRRELRLVFLWFGSWKNGMSSYVPLWVKRDTNRFPRVRLQDNKTVEVLSTFSETNARADAAAFAALMRHIRAVDGDSHTVIMVQVENEVGILKDSRDRSEAANEAFAAAVPDALLTYLNNNRAELVPELRERWDAAGARTVGTWEEMFGRGPETDEIFMAWNYARYIDSVAAAGKEGYALPLFVNAWLNTQSKHGEWPTGGPLPHTMDIWLAGAPHLDLLTPDIYHPDFAKWCALYTRRGNPLFIPEMHHQANGARNVFYAIGHHDAIGTSPFAFDAITDPLEAPLGKSYEALSSLSPLILEHQGLNRMIGVLLDAENPSVTHELGGYKLTISLDAIFDYKAEIGYGLIIATGPDSFVGAGSGFQVSFQPIDPAQGKVGIGSVDEGEYRQGKWIAGRRLNGDENDQGNHWRFNNKKIHTLRCRVYSYS
ncbi:MAG: DUF5597 domain-containing protein [Armatimonadota bacterium]